MGLATSSAPPYIRAMRHYNNAFRAAVAAKMVKRGWNAAELSRRTGIPYSTIDTLLKSDGEIFYSRAMAIKDALKIKRVNPENDGN